MQTRTLSQQIMAAAAVGLATAAATRGIDDTARVAIFLSVGIVLLAFAFSLLFVDWHYQSAFTAIRNALAFIESRQPVLGPWIAHLNARTHFNDHIASYLPFLLLAALGCASIIGGVVCSNRSGAFIFIACSGVAAAFGIVVFFFWRRCRFAQIRDRVVTNHVSNALREKGFDLLWEEEVLVAVRPAGNKKPV
jgi:hypothetical protein